MSSLILWRLLACPVCHSNLTARRSLIGCSNNHRFPVVKGIPVFFGLAGSHHKHQRHYFERFYAQYQQLPKLNWHESYWQTLSSDFQPKSGQFLADIGTGTGWLAIRAAKAGLWVIATELTYEIAARAQRFAEQEGVSDKILFVAADAEHLPIKTGGIDYLTAVAILEHLSEDQQATSEFARVLKRGGNIWMVTPNELKVQPIIFRLILFFYDRMIGHIRHYSLKNLKQLFGKHRLMLISYHYIGHLVKLRQLMLQALIRNDQRWWQLEQIDRQQDQIPSSINLIATFRKY